MQFAVIDHDAEAAAEQQLLLLNSNEHSASSIAAVAAATAVTAAAAADAALNPVLLSSRACDRDIEAMHTSMLQNFHTIITEKQQQQLEQHAAGGDLSIISSNSNSENSDISVAIDKLQQLLQQLTQQSTALALSQIDSVNSSSMGLAAAAAAAASTATSATADMSWPWCLSLPLSLTILLLHLQYLLCHTVAEFHTEEQQQRKKQQQKQESQQHSLQQQQPQHHALLLYVQCVEIQQQLQEAVSQHRQEQQKQLQSLQQQQLRQARHNGSHSLSHHHGRSSYAMPSITATVTATAIAAAASVLTVASRFTLFVQLGKCASFNSNMLLTRAAYEQALLLYQQQQQHGSSNNAGSNSIGRSAHWLVVTELQRALMLLSDYSALQQLIVYSLALDAHHQPTLLMAAALQAKQLQRQQPPMKRMKIAGNSSSSSSRISYGSTNNLAFTASISHQAQLQRLHQQQQAAGIDQWRLQQKQSQQERNITASTQSLSLPYTLVLPVSIAAAANTAAVTATDAVDAAVGVPAAAAETASVAVDMLWLSTRLLRDLRNALGTTTAEASEGGDDIIIEAKPLTIVAAASAAETTAISAAAIDSMMPLVTLAADSLVDNSRNNAEKIVVAETYIDTNAASTDQDFSLSHVSESAAASSVLAATKVSATTAVAASAIVAAVSPTTATPPLTTVSEQLAKKRLSLWELVVTGVAAFGDVEIDKSTLKFTFSSNSNRDESLLFAASSPTSPTASAAVAASSAVINSSNALWLSSFVREHSNNRSNYSIVDTCQHFLRSLRDSIVYISNIGNVDNSNSSSGYNSSDSSNSCSSSSRVLCQLIEELSCVASSAVLHSNSISFSKIKYSDIDSALHELDDLLFQAEIIVDSQSSWYSSSDSSSNKNKNGDKNDIACFTEHVQQLLDHYLTSADLLIEQQQQHHLSNGRSRNDDSINSSADANVASAAHLQLRRLWLSVNIEAGKQQQRLQQQQKLHQQQKSPLAASNYFHQQHAVAACDSMLQLLQSHKQQMSVFLPHCQQHSSINKSSVQHRQQQLLLLLVLGNAEVCAASKQHQQALDLLLPMFNSGCSNSSQLLEQIRQSASALNRQDVLLSCSQQQLHLLLVNINSNSKHVTTSLQGNQHQRRELLMRIEAIASAAGKKINVASTTPSSTAAVAVTAVTVHQEQAATDAVAIELNTETESVDAKSLDTERLLQEQVASKMQQQQQQLYLQMQQDLASCLSISTRTPALHYIAAAALLAFLAVSVAAFKQRKLQYQQLQQQQCDCDVIEFELLLCEQTHVVLQRYDMCSSAAGKRVLTMLLNRMYSSSSKNSNKMCSLRNALCSYCTTTAAAAAALTASDASEITPAASTAAVQRQRRILACVGGCQSCLLYILKTQYPPHHTQEPHSSFYESLPAATAARVHTLIAALLQQHEGRRMTPAFVDEVLQACDVVAWSCGLARSKIEALQAEAAVTAAAATTTAAAAAIESDASRFLCAPFVQAFLNSFGPIAADADTYIPSRASKHQQPQHQQQQQQQQQQLQQQQQQLLLQPPQPHTWPGQSHFYTLYHLLLTDSYTRDLSEAGGDTYPSLSDVEQLRPFIEYSHWAVAVCSRAMVTQAAAATAATSRDAAAMWCSIGMLHWQHYQLQAHTHWSELCLIYGNSNSSNSYGSLLQQQRLQTRLKSTLSSYHYATRCFNLALFLLPQPTTIAAAGSAAAAAAVNDTDTDMLSAAPAVAATAVIAALPGRYLPLHHTDRLQVEVRQKLAFMGVTMLKLLKYLPAAAAAAAMVTVATMGSPTNKSGATTAATTARVGLRLDHGLVFAVDRQQLLHESQSHFAVLAAMCPWSWTYRFMLGKLAGYHTTAADATTAAAQAQIIMQQQQHFEAAEALTAVSNSMIDSSDGSIRSRLAIDENNSSSSSGSSKHNEVRVSEDSIAYVLRPISIISTLPQYQVAKRRWKQLQQQLAAETQLLGSNSNCNTSSDSERNAAELMSVARVFVDCIVLDAACYPALIQLTDMMRDAACRALLDSLPAVVHGNDISNSNSSDSAAAAAAAVASSSALIRWLTLHFEPFVHFDRKKQIRFWPILSAARKRKIKKSNSGEAIGSSSSSSSSSGNSAATPAATSNDDDIGIVDATGEGPSWLLWWQRCAWKPVRSYVRCVDAYLQLLVQQRHSVALIAIGTTLLPKENETYTAVDIARIRLFSQAIATFVDNEIKIASSSSNNSSSSSNSSDPQQQQRSVLTSATIDGFMKAAIVVAIRCHEENMAISNIALQLHRLYCLVVTDTAAATAAAAAATAAAQAAAAARAAFIGVSVDDADVGSVEQSRRVAAAADTAELYRVLHWLKDYRWLRRLRYLQLLPSEITEGHRE